MRTAITAAATVAAATGLMACGDTTLSSADTNAFVKKNIAGQTAAKNVKVDCPDNVKLEKGKTFTCNLNSSLGPATVTVHITAVNNDKASLHFDGSDIKPRGS
jgi:hypothetical protein